MKKLLCLFFYLVPVLVFSQGPEEKLAAGMIGLEQDKQFEHAITGMYVAHLKTGKRIFEHNGEAGLAPASCQKLVTSVAAFELLGKKFSYETNIKLNNEPAAMHLYIEGTGDPTLGSDRWLKSGETNIFNGIKKALAGRKMVKLGSDLFFVSKGISYQPVPDGWVWQDLGNYYGAGAWGFNWCENKYELGLRTGEHVGDSTSIRFVKPAYMPLQIKNFITTGNKNSGDQAYIYTAPYSSHYFATGTLPAGQHHFSIYGAMANPPEVFAAGLKRALAEAGNVAAIKLADEFIVRTADNGKGETIYTIRSPAFDSMNFWFLKKSINLYGEAFVKTIGWQHSRVGSTDSGIAVIKRFWEKNGIELSALKIIDGSGLSPANRVTAHALVQVLTYAKKQSWFSSFYDALPEMNGIKMKDGYIGGVRSYAGYIRSKSGEEYVFAFLVNNFDGSPALVREKMWKILDVLK